MCALRARHPKILVRAREMAGRARRAKSVAKAQFRRACWQMFMILFAALFLGSKSSSFLASSRASLNFSMACTGPSPATAAHT